MSWRYDIGHLTSQQQAIIRKNDEEEARRKKERERLEKEIQKQNDIKEDEDV